MSGQPPIELHQLEPGLIGPLTVLINPGTNGQVLTSNGTIATWAFPTPGTIFLSSLGDVALTALSVNDVLTWNGTKWTNEPTGAGSGTVTSVAATGSTGLVVGGSPITTSGTLTFTLGTELQGLSVPTLTTSTGFVQRTGAGTYAVNTLTSGQVTTALGYTPGTGNGTVTSVAAVGSTGLVVTGSPITSSGTLTLTLGTELQGLSGLSSTGLVARTGAGTYAQRTLSQTGTDFTITNGDGVAGNPTIALTTVATAGTYTQVTVSATGRVTAGGNPGFITGNQTITLSGDVTGSGTTSIATTLATVNANVGTFNNVTVNAKGLVTAASNVAYLTTAVGSVTAGTGITVTGTATAPIVNLANTAVTPGVYTNTNLTVDQQGRITAASSGSAGGVTTFSAGTTGFTPSSATSGAITLAGTLALTNGGTGATTQAGAANAVLPSQGGNANSFLQTDGTNVSWNPAGSGSVTSVSTSATGMGLTLTTATPTTTPAITLAGTLSTAHGGTALTTFTSNGVFYASSSSVITQAINATATNKFLTQVSSGTPAFNVIATGDLPAITTSGDASGTYAAGNIPLTLATVNGNVGSFTNASITVNAKGLITAASTGSGGGVSSVTASGAGITASPTTGAVVVSNTGVTSAVAGTNIAVSGATGAVTISVTGTVASATTATTATNVTATNSASASALDVAFLSAATGSVGILSNASLTYTASTGQLNSTAFNTTSDRNLKTNITKIEDATLIVNSINGVRFDWKFNGLSSAGLIAQEVEEVMPELVSTREDGTKSMNYNGIIGVLIEALKETNAKMAAMALEIEQLKAK